MAIDDAYATAAEYRERTDDQDSGEEADILEMLRATARILEKETGRLFNASAANTARTVDGKPGSLLWIPDITTIDSEGIAVDEDLDGTFETTFDLSDAWAIGGPQNAAEISEPFIWLQLLPLTGNTVLSSWPAGVANIQITGTWGWPEVPGALKEANVLLTRQLRDIHQQGALFAVQALETQIQLTPGAFPFLQNLKKQYTRGDDAPFA